MTITNTQSGTSIQEIAENIYRISTPTREIPGGFSFNQYLIVDDEPLLFHLGMRKLFPLVREAVAAVLTPEKLRYLAFSHMEPDECGAVDPWLALAPQAQPVCGRIGAMIGQDLADRPPRGLAHGETLKLGKHEVSWQDAPHLPHGWDCGFMIDRFTQTLFCGDLFTQGGEARQALVETDILGPSEAFRKKMDYFSHTQNLRPLMQNLIELKPRTLACMHGHAWRGDGGKLLQELMESLGSGA